MNQLSLHTLHCGILRISFAILALCTANAVLHAQNLGEFVILANRNSHIKEIGQTDLARLYLSKTKKIDGQAYRVVNLAEEATKTEFLKDLTSMTEAEIDHHYIALELRGEGEKPKEIASSKGMIFLLLQSDKIIGWLPMSEYDRLSDDVKNHMQVIRIK